MRGRGRSKGISCLKSKQKIVMTRPVVHQPLRIPGGRNRALADIRNFLVANSTARAAAAAVTTGTSASATSTSSASTSGLTQPLVSPSLASAFEPRGRLAPPDPPATLGSLNFSRQYVASEAENRMRIDDANRSGHSHNLSFVGINL